MTSSFSYKRRAIVLDQLTEISRSEIQDYEGKKPSKCNLDLTSEIGANDLILPTSPTLYLSFLRFQEILQLVLADVAVVVTCT